MRWTASLHLILSENFASHPLLPPNVDMGIVTNTLRGGEGSRQAAAVTLATCCNVGSPSQSAVYIMPSSVMQ